MFQLLVHTQRVWHSGYCEGRMSRGGSGCDTVHILSRAVGEIVNEQCCHKSNKWCGLSHHVKMAAEKERLCSHDTQKLIQFFIPQP